MANDQRLVAKPLLAGRNDLRQPGVSRALWRAATPQALSEHRCLLNSHYSGREEWCITNSKNSAGAGFRAVASIIRSAEERALAGAGIARCRPTCADGNWLTAIARLLRDYQTAACRCIGAPIRVVCRSVRKCSRILVGGSSAAARRWIGCNVLRSDDRSTASGTCGHQIQQHTAQVPWVGYA